MKINANVNANILTSEDLDKGLIAAGSNHRYQFFMMFVIFFVKIVTDSFFAPLPYFLMEPKIKCYDDATKEFTKACEFSDVCKFNKDKPLTQQMPYELDPSITQNYSFITGFGIGCDSLRAGHLVSSAAFGAILANIIGPLLTENIGRVYTITVILLTDFVLKGSVLFFNNFWGLYAVVLLINLTNNVIYNCISLYINEMVDSSKRGVYSCLFNSLFGINGILYTLIFNLTFNWKYLQVFSLCATLISLILNVIIFRESVRYLYMKNKHSEIFPILEYIAKFNSRTEIYNTWKRELDDRIAIQDSFCNESSQVVQTSRSASTHPIALIFKKGIVIYHFFAFSIISLVIISGIIYNAVEIKTSTDTFLFPIIFYFTDFLVILGMGFIIDLPFFGRKLPALAFSIMAGIGYFIKYFYIHTRGENSSVFWVDFMIRTAAGISFNILIEYNFEIYSTDIRATAYNINKLISKIGDFMTPLLLYSSRSTTTILISELYFVMSLVIIFVRETSGTKLKESVDEEDAEEKNNKDKEIADDDKIKSSSKGDERDRLNEEEREHLKEELNKSNEDVGDLSIKKMK